MHSLSLSLSFSPSPPPHLPPTHTHSVSTDLGGCSLSQASSLTHQLYSCMHVGGRERYTRAHTHTHTYRSRQTDPYKHTHLDKQAQEGLISPDPEKLSSEVSAATEEAISLLLIGSVLTASKQATQSSKATSFHVIQKCK